MRLFFLLLLAAAVALGYASLNRAAIHAANPTNINGNTNSLRGDVLVNSVDDEYYLNPVENFLAGNGWRRDLLGRSGYARRTPGYSLWFLPFRMALGPKGYYWPLAIGQLLLYLASLAILYKGLKASDLKKGLRRLVLAIYTLAPFFSTYIFFTITEALSATLQTGYVGLLLLAWYTPAGSKRKLRLYILAGLVGVITLLTRPAAGAGVVSLPILLWFDYGLVGDWRTLLRRAAVVGILPILLLTTWTVRNYLVTGEVIVLERYAHPEGHDMYKPSMTALWGLYSTAGIEQARLNAKFFPLFRVGAVQGQYNPAMGASLAELMPADYRNVLGEKRLTAAIQLYQTMLVQDYYPYQVSHTAMPSQYLPAETQLADTFNLMLKQLRRARPMLWVTGPLSIVQLCVAHSNTSHLMMFQQAFRNQHPLINQLRIVILAVHLIIYGLFFGGLLLTVLQVLRVPRPWAWALSLPPILLLAFLCFVVKTTEQRYMLVVMPFLLLADAYFLQAVWQRIRDGKSITYPPVTSVA
jgi:hypothetical protein